MKTSLSPEHLLSSTGQQAQQILRNCVHCGFCNATCPTYQLLGDELDGPRGRIYLIKNFLETGKNPEKLIVHLDRCLTCRNCETTCPSGVEYSSLAEIGRNLADPVAKRSIVFKGKRWLVKTLLSSPKIFSLLSHVGRFFRPLLIRKYRQLLGRRDTRAISEIPSDNASKSVTIFLMQGCVQPSLSPQINIITQHLLQRLGYSIKTLADEQCCGAIHLHNADPERAEKKMLRNVKAWHNSEHYKDSLIVSTASGCGVTLKDYHKTLHHLDEPNAQQAKYFSDSVCDLSEILIQHDNLQKFIVERFKKMKIAVHIPCTLQHGMQLRSTFEQLLDKLSLKLIKVRDSHLCCGSAGTYSIFQKQLSQQLLDKKVDCLTESSPDLIITANIGCLLELSTHSPVPVIHWIELFSPESRLPKEIL